MFTGRDFVRYGVGMDIDALIATLRNPGEDGLPDGIYDDLSASATALREGSASLVAEKEAVIAELTAELQRLKAHNYELLMAVASETTDAETDAEPSDSEVDPADPKIEDIFTNGKDD